jgi:hypothetical protein
MVAEREALGAWTERSYGLATGQAPLPDSRAIDYPRVGRIGHQA